MATPGPTAWAPSHRQGALSVTQLEILPTPPEHRTDNMPWPTYPMVYRVSSAHEEGGERLFSVSTTEFLGDDEGRLRALRAGRGAAAARTGGSSRSRAPSGSWRASSCCWRWASSGPEKGKLLADLGVELDERGNVARDRDFMTSVDGVFTAGDMGRGQSLIVWAIAEGRAAAAGVDAYLTGRDVLPRPIAPTDRPIA